MTIGDIVRYRLINQQIAGTSFKKPSDIVGWMVAMQAQEFALAKWAIGLRLPGVNEAEVDKAFNSGAILRTHLMRPTWHFVTPADIRWMLALTAPRVNAINAYMYRQLELDDKLFKRSNAALEKALVGGKHLTRTTLQEALEKVKIKADGLRLGYIMMRAELDAIICSGPRQGKQFTYALLEERVPSAKPLSPEEALATLSKRYFYSRGPATLKDFAVWSGLTGAQVKAGLALVKGDLMEEKFDGENYYFLPPDSVGKKTEDSIHLLPIYDEYIMSYKNKSAIFNDHRKINPEPKLVFDQTVIADGQIVGTWRRTVNPKVIDIEYDLFKQFSSKRSKALGGTIDRFSTFMSLPVVKKNE